MVNNFLPLAECGGQIHLHGKESVEIQSPGYPLHYGQGINCSWHVHAEIKKSVRIDLIDLQIPAPVSNVILKENRFYELHTGNCKDKIIIQNSYKEDLVITSDNKKAYTGSMIISHRSDITIRLESCFHYAVLENQYFYIKVSQEDFPGCGMDTIGCGTTCTQSSAFISSPRYPAVYDQNEFCYWEINGQFGQFVSFEFLDMDIPEKDATCTQSYVALYDVGLNDETKLLDRYCYHKRRYEPVITSWHKMKIEFRSEYLTERGYGFLGRYTLVNFTQSYDNINNEDCGSDWYYFEGSCYRMFTSPISLTWKQAKLKCEKEDGHLLSIGKKEEMQFIHFLMTNIWKNVPNNEAFKDPNTQTPQPDGLQNEKCSLMRLYSIHTMDDWHDVACAYDKIYNFICEKTAFNHSGGRTVTTDLMRITAFIPRAVIGTQWRCNNGQCIPNEQRCDLKNDCFDQSDENNCESCSKFQCYDTKCISKTRVCDGQIDCNGKLLEDEDQDCKSNIQKTCSDWWVLGARTSGEYRVSFGLNGVQIRGNNITMNGNKVSATVECIFTTTSEGQTKIKTVIHHNQEESKFAKHSTIETKIDYLATIPQIRKLKELSTCTQSFELECHFTENNFWWRDFFGFQHYLKNSTSTCSCPFIGICDPRKTRCNCAMEKRDWYRNDQNDIFVDKAIILLRSPLITYFVVVESLLALNIYVYWILTTATPCPGSYRCYRSIICLSTDQICDGIPQCPEADDEHMCYQKCPTSCHCEDLELKCTPTKNNTVSLLHSIPSNAKSLDFSSSEFFLSNTSFDNFRLLIELNISNCNIDIIPPRSFSLSSNLLILDISFNKLTHLLSHTFHGLQNLQKLLLHGNPLKKIDFFAFLGLQKLPVLEIHDSDIVTLEDNYFTGLSSLRTLNISRNNIGFIEDNTFSNLQSLEKLDIQRNKIRSFSRDIFKGLTSLGFLFADEYVFCCLKPTTVRPENCLPPPDEFSSCSDLMRFDLLRWSLWIIGLCAFFGNLFVLLYRLVGFYSRSAVCLALPLTRDKPSGWEFSTAIFIFVNFALFSFIAIGQLMIYREVLLAGRNVKSQRRRQDLSVARSLFVVVFTDFLCWFPIGVMGLMSLSGRVVISGEVYAWAAVFILPINSALNPFLYTFSAIVKQR
ncbi:hypothetical protein KUTeg_020156, partial [Tegillarca granosa]